MTGSHLLFAFNNAEVMDCRWLQHLFFIWRGGETLCRSGDGGDQDRNAPYLQ